MWKWIAFVMSLVNGVAFFLGIMMGNELFLIVFYGLFWIIFARIFIYESEKL